MMEADTEFNEADDLLRCCHSAMTAEEIIAEHNEQGTDDEREQERS